ncbi:enoyl-CoA hydratase/isomerase family protein [Sphingomonas tabacisoli]|uniref:Enoyl-CoA hydratase/isomerase family protein n=1 Tax=Sphingomonas tabacisoli TaxID=2249466 RepID=A0ABW4I717_9SPHN
MIFALDPFDESYSPLSGNPLQLIDLPGDEAPAAPIRIGVDREGLLPPCDVELFDALVTTSAAAPAPWVSVSAGRLESALKRVSANIRRAPVAASILARLLRLGVGLSFDAALAMESFAYSTLLGGTEFKCWLAERPASQPAPISLAPVRYSRTGDDVILTLSAPETRNAMTAAMRDALYESLFNALHDPTQPRVELRGEGRSFSVGGDLQEFGSATDLATAHIIRMQRSAALLIHALGDRASVRLHGACIGSGIEIAAAATRRVAERDFYMQLPELGMGLIPGAGGTITLPRAIGRQRTFWAAAGGFRIPVDTALAWGLLHAAEP